MSIEWVSVTPGRTEIGSDNRSILFGGIGPKHMVEISYQYSIAKHPIRIEEVDKIIQSEKACLLYTSPSPRDGLLSRMPSSA